MKQLLEKLGSLDKKKMILLALFCGLVFYLFFSFLLSAQMNSMKQKGPQIARLKNSLDTFNREFAQMNQAKSKQSKLQTLSLAKKIISGDEKVSVLQSLSDIANKNNIQIIQMRHAEEPVSKQDKAAPKINATPFQVILDIDCDYHNLGRFIADIENSNIFWAVQSLKITPQAADTAKHKVNLILRTYVRK